MIFAKARTVLSSLSEGTVSEVKSSDACMMVFGLVDDLVCQQHAGAKTIGAMVEWLVGITEQSMHWEQVKGMEVQKVDASCAKVQQSQQQTGTNRNDGNAGNAGSAALRCAES